MLNWLRYALVCLAAAALAACSSSPSSAPSTTTATAPTSSAAPATCSVHARNAIISAMDIGAVCYTVAKAVQMDTTDQWWVTTGYQISATPEQYNPGRMYVQITRTTEGYRVVLDARDRSDYGKASEPAYYQGGGWIKVATENVSFR